MSQYRDKNKNIVFYNTINNKKDNSQLNISALSFSCTWMRPRCLRYLRRANFSVNRFVK